MNDLTSEWVEKAENDYRTAVVVLEEILAGLYPNGTFQVE